MDIAIVTGAETPLGLRIIERLIQQGCRVHGIGNNFSKVAYADKNFIGHAVDLTDLAALQAVAELITEKEQRVNILIHAIDVTPGAPFEKLPVGNLEAILRIGLLGPVMLTRLMLPNLLRFRGQLINLIPSNKSGSPASAVNVLIEGGLREMNNALFDRARDAGLRVTNLVLRQNQSLPSADASDEQLSQSRIDPEHVARVIEQLINENEPNVPNEITLHPRLSAKAETALPETVLQIDPYSTVILPPKEYCPPEPEPIVTKEPESVERVIPYTDDELEDRIAAAIEDFESKPERHKAAPRKQNRESTKSDSRPEASEDGESSGKKKRRRRRGGRNRNRSENSKDTDRPQNENSTQTEPAPVIDESARKESEESASERSNRRRGGRGRNREKTHQESPEMQGESPSVESPKPQKQKVSTPTEAENKPVSPEKPVKKTAKKATKKKATKKKTAKKVVKKKAAKKAAKKKVVTKEEN